MTSAYLPGVAVPTSFSFFIATAGQKVAARRASIGSTPKTRTQASISRQAASLWKLSGTPLSAPTSTPAAGWAPGVGLARGGVAVGVGRHAAVGADQQDGAGVAELLELALQGRPARR